MELASRPLDGEALLLFVENDRLKNEIVTIQDRIAQRRDPLPDTPNQRLHGLVAYYHGQISRSESERVIDELKSAALDEEEELARLHAIVERNRAAHQAKNET